MRECATPKRVALRAVAEVLKKVSVTKLRGSPRLLSQCQPTTLGVASREGGLWAASYGDVCVEPNQAPEPTPLLVMPRACARVTPSSGVAHL